MNLGVVFLTGLTVGSLSCLAVQGGLLASVITARENEAKEKNKKNIFPTLTFLLAKLATHTTLGFFLGGFGEVIGINQTTQTIMQFIAGIYMIAVALNLLNVHPIFRYTVITPPKFLTKRIKNQSRSNQLFAPAMLGAMTVFIPCGTTLAMEALAISSANAITGALVMLVFVLGTTPLFFGVGWLTTILGENFKKKFFKVAAFAVLYLGATSINGALVASNSPLSAQSLTKYYSKPKFEKLYDEAPVVQQIKIDVTAAGYSPNYIKVKKDNPVTVTLNGVNAFSCASAFRIPSLGIAKNLKPDEVYSFTFTPKQKGKITFTCSMGMYSGVIEVI